MAEIRCGYAVGPSAGSPEGATYSSSPNASFTGSVYRIARFHEQVMGMLPIVQGLAVCRLASLQDQWIAALSDGQRLGAEHEVSHDLTRPERVPRHAHQRVGADE